MIIKHNVFERWSLADKSIQAIMTSPPYWGLRKYDIPDVVIGNWKGQHGLEPSFKDYIEHTRLWTSEAWRVLKDDGLFFLNLGDSYNSHTAKSKNVGGFTGKQMRRNKEYSDSIIIGKPNCGLKDKCKILIPHRVAIALIDDGWILRNDIVWYKPNAMPESCRDRFSKKFEYVFMFSKQGKYYFDLDAVREDYHPDSYNPNKIAKKSEKADEQYISNKAQASWHKKLLEGKLKGKNPGDLWTINTQPSPFKHYAMFPEKLVERIIKCSTKEGDTVLDPFCGSGTTQAVAIRLGRKAIGFDLGYQNLQKERLKDLQPKMLFEEGN